MQDATELHDKEAIRTRLHLYCRAADRCDWDSFASTFHEDATVDHGQPQTKWEFVNSGRQRIESMWEGTQHMLGQIHIEIEGLLASSEAYLIAHHVSRPSATSERRLVSFGGRYLDRFEKRAGQWKIKNRILVKDWQDDRLYQPPEGWNFQLGRRGMTDPMYRFFSPAT